MVFIDFLEWSTYGISVRLNSAGELFGAGKALNSDGKRNGIFKDRNTSPVTVAEFISSMKNMIEIDGIINIFGCKVCIQCIAGNSGCIIFLANSCTTESNKKKKNNYCCSDAFL